MCREELIVGASDEPKVFVRQVHDPILSETAEDWEIEALDEAGNLEIEHNLDDHVMQEVIDRSLVANMPLRGVLTAPVPEHASFAWDIRHMYSNLSIIMAQIAYHFAGAGTQDLPLWDPLYNPPSDPPLPGYKFWYAPEHLYPGILSRTREAIRMFAIIREEVNRMVDWQHLHMQTDERPLYLYECSDLPRTARFLVRRILEEIPTLKKRNRAQNARWVEYVKCVIDYWLTWHYLCQAAGSTRLIRR